MAYENLTTLLLPAVEEIVTGFWEVNLTSKHLFNKTSSLPLLISRFVSSTPTVIPTLPSGFTKVTVPPEMMMISLSSQIFIGIYCILFVVGTVGNLSVVVSTSGEIWRKCNRSRIKILILHLSVADLCVILFIIPIEIFWRITISWEGGWFLCKACQFFRAFGLYLSSNVIICISLDRFYVIISPLKAIGGMKRVKNMLIVAWTCAIIFATPQILVFNMESHPLFLSFGLCVTYRFFVSVDDEILYNMISVTVMYFAPLVVILFTYVGVLVKVSRRSRQHQHVREFQQKLLQQRILLLHPTSTSTSSKPPDGLMITSRILLKRAFASHPPKLSSHSTGQKSNGNSGASSHSGVLHRTGSQFLRMSSTVDNLNRSRRHAFFLTMLIITVFVFLWSPYYLLILWHMVDWKSAKMIDSWVQQAFFIMAVSNSCLNPIIYGNVCFQRRQAPSTTSDDQRSGQRRDATCDARPL